ncbi:GNAT family N-acetyltransferase [Streptomyces sp. A7024]|uniref:GNAT family N-acetyltransferase n=1 Tax=Streptomyces coryli TaxID=1128680 RepID=A0A6G4U4D7_9ACTN|nr:GNAT family N-acetyltransferase [Streptomyces coryli]NGN66238.1 GNAT family N-acetyltransferase [Streptomyces coryli]
MTDTVIRHLTAGEEHLFRRLPDSAVIGRAAFGLPRWASLAEGGEYRLDWTWVALRDGVVVARAAWWAGPGDTEPKALDWFDFTDAEAAAELLRTAPLRAELMLQLPSGWRELPGVREQAQAVIDAAGAAGMQPFVERYQYEWTTADGVPERPGRLTFRPEPDEDAIYEVLLRVEQGSLDAHARRDAEEGGIELAAREELEFFKWCPSPPDWWQLAYDADGELVGLHIPARNQRDHIIGFIGIVPEQRGHGYAYDLLVECTHVLVAAGAEKIVAATDVPNTPMARNFAKAGYPVAHERYYMQ